MKPPVSLVPVGEVGSRSIHASSPEVSRRQRVPSAEGRNPPDSGSCSECHMGENEGRKLKTLSCGHPYCSFCMFLVTKDQQGHMPCPKCRQEVLSSMVADTRYQQLSGAICLRHGDPVTLYCCTCKRVVCRICTMLEHRPNHGHLLIDKKEESENRFRDLFGALDQVENAQKNLSNTTASVMKVLRRNMDIAQREIKITSDRILDREHEEFRDFLDSELSKLAEIAQIIADLQDKTSVAAADFDNVHRSMKTVIKNEKPVPVSDVDFGKFIEKPFGVLGCEPLRMTDRLSVTPGKPPSHFADWLGNAVGVLWVLPQQILLIVDERYGEGEDVCIYSFNANDLTKVDWTDYVKPTNSRAKSVVCDDIYRHQSECWVWVAAGAEIFQVVLDISKEGCPIKYKRTICLEMPPNAIGVSAVACMFGETYMDNTFMVTTESMTNSLLRLHTWNGEHREDIALGRISRSITGITLRSNISLVICDAESAIVRSYHQDSFTTRDQHTFTLKMGNVDPSKVETAIPISAVCNKMGDLLILWVIPGLRKNDIVYTLWNLTAHELDSSGETGRIYVVAAGNSLETGIPVDVDCWDYDVAVCFQDGGIKVFKNFPILDVSSSDWAGQPEAIFQKSQRKSREHRSSADLHGNSPLMSIRAATLKSGQLRKSRIMDFH